MSYDYLKDAFRFPIDHLPKARQRRLLARTLRADRRLYKNAASPWRLGRLTQWARPRLTRPIFVIGAPRSGTTFLGECLASVPSISYHFEPIATKVAAHYVYTGAWTHDYATRFYKHVYRALQRQHFDGDLRFCEKTPRNSFIVPFLAKAFPDAQFIHITRDGRDCALSLMQKPWFKADSRNSGRYEPGGYRYGPDPLFWIEPERSEEYRATSDFHRCIWTWKRFIEAAIASGRKLPTSRYLEFRYEDLVLRPASVTKTILEFLEITSATDTRAFLYATQRNARTASVGRWQSELTDAQKQIADEEASELIREFAFAGTAPNEPQVVASTSQTP